MTKKKTPKQQQLLDKLATMMQDGSVDRTRTLAYLRQKTRGDARGRPPLDRKTGESYQVTFRMTKAQIDYARKQAKRQRVTVSAWIRSFVTQAIDSATKTEENLQQTITTPTHSGEVPVLVEQSQQSGG